MRLGAVSSQEGPTDGSTIVHVHRVGGGFENRSEGGGEEEEEEGGTSTSAEESSGAAAVSRLTGLDRPSAEWDGNLVVLTEAEERARAGHECEGFDRA